MGRATVIKSLPIVTDSVTIAFRPPQRNTQSILGTGEDRDTKRMEESERSRSDIEAAVEWKEKGGGVVGELEQGQRVRNED